MLSDGLHLSPAGSELLFQLLWPLVDERTRQLPLCFPLSAELMEQDDPSVLLLPTNNSNL